MKAGPLISVCIPTYNSPESLERCVRSALSQTYPYIEIVITDDSPNNITEAMIRTKFKDERIRYYKNEAAFGSPGNWNEAMRKATGSFIKMLHHDDWFSTDTALQKFLDAMRGDPSERSLVFSSAVNCFGNRKSLVTPTGAFLRKLKSSPDILLYSNRIGAPSVTFFSRESFRWFDENTRWFVDLLFYRDFLNANENRFIHIREPLVNITAGLRTQMTSIISNREKFAEAVYAFRKAGNIEQVRHRFLFKAFIRELLLRYKISENELLNSFSEAFPGRAALPWWYKIPLPYQVFSLLRYLRTRIV